MTSEIEYSIVWKQTIWEKNNSKETTLAHTTETLKKVWAKIDFQSSTSMSVLSYVFLWISMKEEIVYPAISCMSNIWIYNQQ